MMEARRSRMSLLSLRVGKPTRPPITVPFQFLLVMTFTTPPMASEPYKAEAPSFNTSTRSTIESGIAQSSPVEKHKRGQVANCDIGLTRGFNRRGVNGEVVGHLAQVEAARE